MARTVEAAQKRLDLIKRERAGFDALKTSHPDAVKRIKSILTTGLLVCVIICLASALIVITVYPKPRGLEQLLVNVALGVPFALLLVVSILWAKISDLFR